MGGAIGRAANPVVLQPFEAIPLARRARARLQSFPLPRVGPPAPPVAKLGDRSISTPRQLDETTRGSIAPPARIGRIDSQQHGQVHRGCAADTEYVHLFVNEALTDMDQAIEDLRIGHGPGRAE